MMLRDQRWNSSPPGWEGRGVDKSDVGTKAVDLVPGTARQNRQDPEVYIALTVRPALGQG